MKIATALIKAAAAAIGLTTASASFSAVTSAFDGNWYDPTLTGQGFIFETYPQDNGEIMLMVIYFSYDSQGRPTFFTGSSIVAGSTIQMDLLRPTVGPQTQPGIFEPPMFVPVGKLRLDLNSCQGATANVSFNPGVLNSGDLSKIRVGSGSFRLQRLGRTFQVKRCTGGLSDNLFANNAPLSLDETIPTTQFKTRVKYEGRPDGAELNLQLRSLPVGNYNLEIGGVQVDSFTVQAFGSSTLADLRFRSPRDSFSRDLDFDFFGQEFRIVGAEARNAGINELFTIQGDFTPLNNGFVNAGPASQPLAVSERLTLAQVRGAGRGVLPNFLLDTRFERDSRRGEFRITVDGAEPGSYEVLVGQTRRGTLVVSNEPGVGPTGQVIFRDPVSPGSYTLDFDPRGQQLSLVRDGVIDFEVILR